RTTSLVAGLSMRLRTLPSRPQGLDPFFDNKYSVASLPGAECYTWSRPQSYAISELTNTLVVRGNVQIECIRQTAGAPDPVRTTEEPVTWYFSLKAKRSSARRRSKRNLARERQALFSALRTMRKWHRSERLSQRALRPLTLGSAL